MIEAMIVLAAILLWLGLIFGAVCLFLEDMPKLGILVSVAAFLYTSWGLSVMFIYERENPCVRYETSMQYNPATKTVMPMRICVQRGEWVKE